MQKKYTVSLGKNRTLIADYMSEALGFSSRQAKKLLKDKKVCINGKTAYRDNKLSDGDIIEIDLSEEPRKDILPENIELSIIYEDEHLLAVNKPPFMMVHPTPNHPNGTLLNGVAYYFEKQGIKAALRLLNRLDMNTSGIVVIPKSAAVHSKLNGMIKAGEVKKFYLAVIEGNIEPEKGIIDEPIGKDETDSIRRKVKADGQPAVTIYETLKKSKGHSLVRLELITGRTHQIRVHLSYLGHPVAGDTLYGKVSRLIGRQALHASDMELIHPEAGNTIKLHGELPEDMRILVSRLELE
jgi:23S rRNA pseudouridine1911/1915/1917 synthase